ncbi:MAG: hypothetical protein Q9166_000895 [cf. Caloplaca sp. 2 TL-2023]
MSAQNSKGIQTLLDAEREAQKIVQKAREYRSKRVKDARSEAQKEIEDYRKQKEEEFQKFENEVRSHLPTPPILPFSSASHLLFALFFMSQPNDAQQTEEDANNDAEEQVKAIKTAGDKQGQKVVDDLLRVVTDVRPEVPDRVNAPAKA